MKKTLEALMHREILSRKEAADAMLSLGRGEVNAAQTAAFLAFYQIRLPAVDEMLGFRDALLALCLRPTIDASGAIDIVGTGGDGKNTFNISTLTCFVVAGAGFRVIKHGNYGVSSAVGSSNVLEYLGLTFTNDSDVLNRRLEASGFCMLHAPLFHPAMKHVAPVRKELGMKTIFNLLGPLVNPAEPEFSSLGTYNLASARLYHYILQASNTKYGVVHALDGYDEISLTGAAAWYSNKGLKQIAAEAFGLEPLQPEALWGGETAEEAAAIFKNVLENKSTLAQRNAVLANSAIALSIMQEGMSLVDCRLQAEESLDSGKALQALQKCLSVA